MESTDKDKGQKKAYEVQTFSVPFALEAIKENISISTIANSQKSEEPIINKAFQLHSQGKILEAEKYYKHILNKGSNDPEVFSNYGIILKDLGKLQEAELSTRKAIELNPSFANAHSNLGIILKDLGKLQDAELSLKNAVEINPGFANAHFNLGIILKDLGKLQDAELSLKNAIELDPNLTEAKLTLELINKERVPKWHIPMMNDIERNNSYLKAIKVAIKDNKNILEIGTGSGLLSMMAIDAGAKKVTTCEATKTIAEAAKKIIAKNGYSEKIKVINKKSTELIVGKDLDQKVDLVLSEILSSEFVGEGVQPTLSDANKRLLKENGRMIPESGEIKAALLESSKEIEQELFVKNVNGYDLSEFNNIMGSKFSLPYLSRKIKPSFLSEPTSPFYFDLYNKDIINKKVRVIEMKATKSGICLGLITWIKLNLFDDIFFENSPNKTSTSGWMNPFYKFNQPLKISEGEVIKIKATLLKDNVWFELME